MNIDDIILFAPIEGNLKDINTKNKLFKRFFETEAILCFKCWRKNGGVLKDIPIIAYCPTRFGVSEETKKIFNEINVTYIEDYQKETELYECGFWNIPLVGKLIENNPEYKNKILIKIDLDMYLIKPLNLDILKYTPAIVVHTLGHNNYIENHLKDDFFNTGFLISKSCDKFYTKQLDMLYKLENSFKNNKILTEYGLDVSYERTDKTLEFCLLEEVSVNYLIKDGYDIVKLESNYWEGEEDESSNDINNIYFIHEHITDKLENIDIKLKYKKLFNNFNIYGFNYLFDNLIQIYKDKNVTRTS